ncbi:MAG: carboxypeptidase regulatory-like domain-containing protein [Gemmatimonadaceae bacterium]|nr:carboxypeptidase regulatory-like domain-containing protein [Gemmatimonadaceae bacterium]
MIERRPTRRIWSWLLALWIVGTVLCLEQARAQVPVVTVRVEGEAFDSLAKRPLVGAFIFVAGTGRSATSDARGRFRLDSVPLGEQLFTLQHAAFDSLGLSGATMRATVRNGMSKVLLTVPSFATLWRAVCGNTPAPNDSALIYGNLSTADGGTLTERAIVEASWVDLVGGGKSLAEIGQRRWRRRVETDERGEYALCGVAPSVPLTLRAARSLDDTINVTTLQLEAGASRVQRRDLRLGAVRVAYVDPAAIARTGTSISDSASSPLGAQRAENSGTGVVSGVVTNSAGVPLANAVIAVDTLPEVRSGDDGRFRVAGVGIGTRQTLVAAIGMTPQMVTMNVSPRDTTRLVITMQPVQLLDAVRVRANASTVAGVRVTTFEEHKRLGLGAFRDSTDFVGQTSIVTGLRMIPGLTVRTAPGGRLVLNSQSCGGFRLFVDGHPVSSEELMMLQPSTIAAMETYLRRLIYPSDAVGGGCSIAVWTKAAFGKP